MSQGELARWAGMSRNTIVKLELAQTSDPELLTIARVARGLGRHRAHPEETNGLVVSFVQVFVGERIQDLDGGCTQMRG